MATGLRLDLADTDEGRVKSWEVRSWRLEAFYRKVVRRNLQAECGKRLKISVMVIIIAGRMNLGFSSFVAEFRGALADFRDGLAGLRHFLADFRRSFAEVRSGFADIRSVLAELRRSVAEARDGTSGQGKGAFHRVKISGKKSGIGFVKKTEGLP